MGWLAIILAFVIAPILLIGVLNWAFSGFPIGPQPPRRPGSGLGDNGFVLWSIMIFILLCAAAYELLVAPFVFEWIAEKMAKAFGVD